MISARRRGALALLWLAAACTGCTAPADDGRTLVLRGPAMGTTWSVKIVAPPDGLAAAGRKAAETLVREELARVDALMSTWNADSELSRFNRSTDGKPFALSPANQEVLGLAAEFSELTGGAFDVTVGPLVEAWGFGPGGRRDAPPDLAELARLRDTVGMGLLEIGSDGATVRKLHPGVRCDFSGLAAGYVADRIADRLSEQGLTNFLVDMSGELKASGLNEQGRPWRVAIERPQVEGRSINRVVALTDTGIATSGDYRNFQEIDGKRASHLLDPRTGRPAEHALASVTVLDDETVRADALSTALMVLGPNEGMALADKLALAALFLVREDDGSFRELESAAFRKREVDQAPVAEKAEAAR